ncbi:hypothetical protein SASPL_103716 [Salvia splendens]|uniref:Dynein light chain 1, cytoplasmic n=1 Tax=Salvia splendens TaxID=180675 RepID=A0A8X8YK84_SALSN|nr:hypothetical protein SASPL_103716 [Salvia splendens]
MSQDTKRNGGGAAAALSSSAEDRKSSIGSNPSKKVIIKSADMKEDIQKEAIDIAIGAFEKFSVEKDVAEHIKKTFDKKYGPTWHCIVGKNFGSRTALVAYSNVTASQNGNRHVMGFNMGFVLLDYMVTLEHIDCEKNLDQKEPGGVVCYSLAFRVLGVSICHRMKPDHQPAFLMPLQLLHIYVIFPPDMFTDKLQQTMIWIRY